ncbi:MBL fold metallo-hydrolase [Streptacidiphilus sp. EB129]|uniref:MBL fold metallo-hydrolase n=1 Tax=Streptacidiphilus sp. EB129 TaxID=3156262 RepID=UPI003513EDDE
MASTPAPGRATHQGPAWREVADRVFQRRYEPCDVTVGAVVGSEGLLVVDTRCSLAEGRELREHLRQLSAAPVRWVVNTHSHFDHVWGNAEFTAPRLLPPAQLWAHRAAAASMRDSGSDQEAVAFKELMTAKGGTWAAGMAELVEVVPDHLVDLSHTLDLGDRLVELRHPGRGHTDGDLLVHIPDADALLAGDLVEESGPPALGPDSYPLDWAPTLDAVLAGIGPDTVIVPGHGDPVAPAFVRAQRDRLAATAARLTRLHAAGVPASEALAADTGWLFDADTLTHAVPRAYAQLDGTLG